MLQGNLILSYEKEMAYGNVYVLFSSLLLLLLSTSCQRDEPPEPVSFTPDTEQEGMMKLGKKIPNAFTVNNMREAFKSIKENSLLKRYEWDDFTEEDIEATHLYVRFQPQTIEEYYELAENDSLELYDYPFDYEIEQWGDYYHSPEIPQNEQTWLYTTVKVDYEFIETAQKSKPIIFEILDSLFLPDEYFNTDKKRKNVSQHFLYMLEMQALNLVGINEKIDFDNSKGSPSGYIKVYDSYNQKYIPVKRIKVRTRRYFTIKTAYTLENGYYSISHNYNGDAHYSLVLKNRLGFKIWGDWWFLSPARYEFGEHSSSWKSLDISASSQAWRWTVVNNAVYEYFNYCNQLGITKPPDNLRIWVSKNENGVYRGSAAMLRRTWGLYGFTTNSQLLNFYAKFNILNISANALAHITKFAQPDITISVPCDNNSVSSRNRFAYVMELTFHECAHASHWSIVRSEYWVKYINYIITYGAYGNGTGANAGYCGVGEMWAYYFGYRLLDTYFNQDFFYRPGNLDKISGWIPKYGLYHIERQAGYSPSQIFSCLKPYVTSITKLKNEMNTTVGINQPNVNQIFSSYGY